VIPTPRRVWATAALVFVAAAAIYWLSAVHLVGRPHSPDVAYFDQLAGAILQGRVHLLNPPSSHDLTFHNGRAYVPFPPLPALLILPWVALGGVESVNTVAFSAAIGGANVSLMFLLLQWLAARGWTHLTVLDNVWLAALFGVGSVHWYMATIGSVWLVSQICTVMFLLLSVGMAVAGDAPILCGAAMAAAMLGRPHVALCYPLLLAIAMQRTRESEGCEWNRMASWILRSTAPMAATAVALLAYNWLRFGDLLDFGYAKQNVAGRFTESLQTYGLFDSAYIPHNLWTMWIAPPLWDGAKQRLVPDPEGMSVLLTTPAFVYLARARPRNLVMVGAWLSFGLLLIPLVTYYNTGWVQFGYRFSLDFMVPVTMLLAFAAGHRVSWPMRGLIVLGVLVNAWGVVWHGNPDR